MRHSKIFTRSDGSKVEIEVSLMVSWTTSKEEWVVSVYICAPKKRSWFGVYSTNDYDYRRLNQQEREDYIREKQLLHCTEAEILETKLELWNKIKPTI